MRKHINKIFCFCIPLLVLVTSCQKDEEPVSTAQSIDEVLNSTPDFSMYAYIIKKANLEIFTKGIGPYTFFIPSNSSFAALGLNTPADVDKLDPLYLVVLGTYHFQGVKRTFYEIPEGPNASMNTQTNVVQYGTRNSKTDKAYINGVEVLDKGTETSNGIYFKVADIIQPPFFSSAITQMQASSSNNNYSLMLQAIAKTATTTSFTTTPATVFAIPNSVMLANGYDSTTIANISGTAATALTNTLRYHVLPQRIFKSDFRVGNQFTRFTSNSVTIEGTLGSFTIKGKNNPTGVPVGNGIATGSGVFYSISQMLKP